MNYRRCDVVDHGRYTVVDIRCEIASRLLLLCAHHASAQICQHAVVMQPSSSQALCALGEAMLHSYDNMKPERKATAGDSSEAEVALKSAQMSFRASIDMEGKPAVSRGETDLDFISCHLYYDQHSYSCAVLICCCRVDSWLSQHCSRSILQAHAAYSTHCMLVSPV